MPWPLGGNWDRATTPPGASTADIAPILAALCLAVNQRESQMTIGYYPDTALSETQFFYTGNGTAGSKKARPLSSDFAGPIRGSSGKQLIKNTLLAIKDAISGLVENPLYCWSRVALVSPVGTFLHWRFGSVGGDPTLYVWAAANVGRTWNPDDALWADNYLILRAALNLLTGITNNFLVPTFPAGPGPLIYYSYTTLGIAIDNTSGTIPVMGGHVVESTLTMNAGGLFIFGWPAWKGHLTFASASFVVDPFQAPLPFDPFSFSGQTIADFAPTLQGAIDASLSLPWTFNSAGAGAGAAGPTTHVSANVLKIETFRDLSTFLTDQT